MALVTVSSRRYLALDRASKLLGVVLLTLALVPDVLPQYSLFLGVLGVLFGVATAFVDAEEESRADEPGPGGSG